jgi:tripartite motif-containing protein 71
MRALLLRPLVALLPLAALGASDYALVKQWGGLGSKPGEFHSPTMIAVDRNSSVYVVDQYNHRIQKFDAEGRFLLTWGEPGDGAGQFNYPFGIAIDSRGDVYVSDMNNQRVQKFTAQGKFVTMAGRYGSGQAEFRFPYGLAIDANDTLYVLDTLNHRVQKLDRNLKFQDAWGSEDSIGVRVYMPHEITVLPDGNIALSDRQNHRISVFTAGGSLVRRFGEYKEGPASAGGNFSEPHGLAVTPDGALVVCDRYNFRVQKFAPRGEFQLFWGTAGPVDDSLHFPLGITADKAGNVYVTDHYQHSVQKYRLAN